MPSAHRVCGLAACLAYLLSGASAEAASLVWLGTPDGTSAAEATAISADGRFVAARFDFGGAARWDSEAGGADRWQVVSPAFPPASLGSVDPTSVSNHGHVGVVDGRPNCPRNGLGLCYLGARYREDTGFQYLAFDEDAAANVLPTSVRALSDDGSIAVGSHTAADDNGSPTLPGEATWYDYDADRRIKLGFPSSGYGVSGDGLTMVGSGADPATLQDRAFLWSESGGLEFLASLPGGNESAAVDVSNAVFAFGQRSQIAVGWQDPAQGGREAVLWDARANVELLGANELRPRFETVESWANAISHDGEVVVGTVVIAGVPSAFVWTADGGARFLEDELVALGLVLPDGVSLQRAIDISADGLRIAGTGILGDGSLQPFVAFLPEPGTGPLLAIGLAWLTRRAARTRRSSCRAVRPIQNRGVRMGGFPRKCLGISLDRVRVSPHRSRRGAELSETDRSGPVGPIAYARVAGRRCDPRPPNHARAPSSGSTET